MKKWISMGLTLIIALTLAACGAEAAVKGPEVPPESGGVQADTPAPDTSADTWGVTMTAVDVTSTGLTLVISHSGDAPAGELNTGSPFWLERRTQDGQWEKVPTLFPDEEIAWTMEAWLIPFNDSHEYEVNWEYLYGRLSAGQYRVGKEIMLFRGPGDFDKQNCYAQFEIKN